MDAYAVATAHDSVRIERLLPGPIERVWDYLTDSEKRGRWFAAGDMEPRAGGRLEFVFDHARLSSSDDAPPARYARFGEAVRMPGRVIAFEPPHLLAFSWGEDAVSEARFELTPQGDHVRLVVTHTRIASREGMLRIAAGWHTHLDILAAHLHGGEELDSFWRTFARLEGEYDARIAR